MERQQYNIHLEIRDRDQKLFKHPKAGMFTGFKFFQEFKDYEHMEFAFRHMHDELKMLMPENTFYLTASLYNSIGDSWSDMASLYGPEDRFVIFT